MNERLARLNGIPTEKPKTTKERIEKLEADLDYIAMMSDVEIPVEDEEEAE